LLQAVFIKAVTVKEEILVLILENLFCDLVSKTLSSMIEGLIAHSEKRVKISQA